MLHLHELGHRELFVKFKAVAFLNTSGDGQSVGDPHISQGEALFDRNAMQVSGVSRQLINSACSVSVRLEFYLQSKHTLASAVLLVRPRPSPSISPTE